MTILQWTHHPTVESTVLDNQTEQLLRFVITGSTLSDCTTAGTYTVEYTDSW